MTGAFLVVCSCLLNLAGFLLLAASQKRRWHKITGRPRSIARIASLRVMGSACFLLSLALSVESAGSGFGAVTWLFLLTVSALMTTFVMTWLALG